MKEIYAMQRANGDWFALDDHGRFLVPLFQSTRDGLSARLRNFGMQLFKPVALDALLLEELVTVGGKGDVAFLLVSDPLIKLNLGSRMDYAELALRVRNSEVPQIVTPRGDTVEHVKV
jgi:hypothetical protein